MTEDVLRAEGNIPLDAELSQVSSALVKGSQALQDINDQFAPHEEVSDLFSLGRGCESRHRC